MVLVIIVVVAWIAILSPSLMKRRSRSGGEIGSISHFHRQLRVLEHSAPPPLVTPAYRLRAVDGGADPARAPGRSGAAAMPVLTVVGADQLPRPALAFLGEDLPEGEGSVTVPAPVGPGVRPVDRSIGPFGSPSSSDPLSAPTRAVDPVARHLVLRRRRDTLGVLSMVFLGSMMIGFVPGAGPAWVLTALAGVALVGYVAQLVHLRKMAEEREQKLRYLMPADRHQVDADTGPGAGMTVSGRYAHPSNQVAIAH